MAYVVNAPIPGIFYRRPSPEAKEFFQEGEVIESGDVVGLIEVMKTYFEVKAERRGKVVRFLVNNEDFIDAGQPILEVE